MAEVLTTNMKLHERWSIEILAAQERQKQFWKDGSKVLSRFLDDRNDSQNLETSLTGDNPFRLNLYHANVTTLMAMLYGRVPETDVSRRWGDPNDDVARISAEILQRLINISVQEPGSNDADLLRSCLQDYLLPGLGQMRVKYEFEKETVQQRVQSIDPITGMPTIEMVEEEVISDESSPLVYVHWRDFMWGYARTWSTVPWVGFTIYMTKPEAVERFGNDIANQLSYMKKPAGHKDDDSSSVETDDTWYKAELVEIWEKSTRKVYWWAKGISKMLDQRDDPLKLQGFFPCPPPMAANCTTTMFLPKSDFKMAQDLYNQIDVLQTRIGIITKAVKVVGVYDQNSEGVVRMMNEGVENDLIPVDNWAMFADKGGLQGQIDWLPLETIVNALATLEGLRNTQIQLLYQITGMSDILRGQSEQYAGVGQEQLKAKFASIRVQYLQDEFARFASDVMSIRAEIIRKHYEPESIYVQSNAQYLMDDPQAVQEGIAFLKDPNNNLLWKVEIKPESVAMIDYAQLKAERTEYLTAVATFLQSATTMGNVAPEAIPALLEMLKWGLAGFKGGQQIEGVIDRAIKDISEQAKNPPQEQPNPKIQEIQAKAQAEQQKQMQKSQDEMMKMLNQHKAKLMEVAAENKADLSVEQAQAFYNILEHEVKFDFDSQLKDMERRNRREA